MDEGMMFLGPQNRKHEEPACPGHANIYKTLSLAETDRTK